MGQQSEDPVLATSQQPEKLEETIPDTIWTTCKLSIPLEKIKTKGSKQYKYGDKSECK